MANRLISGPAGADKSARARELREAETGPAVIADFQSLYVAISGDVRLPDGTYPLRDERLLPTVEYMRKTLVRAAAARDISVVATNSDGDEIRRRELAELMGEELEDIEEIIDPGEEVVKARLSSRRTGRLSAACKAATDRWYRRRERRR